MPRSLLFVNFVCLPVLFVFAGNIISFMTYLAPL